MAIDICVVGLQQQLPDSRTCAELQTSSVAAANVLKLTGEVWPAEQFDQVPKPVVEPGEIGRHSIAQERPFEARFPAPRSLGQQIPITQEKRVRAEVFGKARLLDTGACAEAQSCVRRQSQRYAQLRIRTDAELAVVLNPHTSCEVQTAPSFHLLLRIVTCVVAQMPLVFNATILPIEIDSIGKAAKRKRNIAVILRAVPPMCDPRDTEGAEKCVVVLIASIGKMLSNARSRKYAIRQTSCAFQSFRVIIRPERCVTWSIHTGRSGPRPDIKQRPAQRLPRIRRKYKIAKITCIAVVIVWFDVVRIQADKRVGPIELSPRPACRSALLEHSIISTLDRIITFG